MSVGLAHWQPYPLNIPLPAGEASSLCRRALQFSVPEGGRFEVRVEPEGAVITLWSSHRPSGGTPAEPVGAVMLRWKAEAPSEAYIACLACDPARQDSGPELFRAMQVLYGQLS
jgi:hypothetical protein